MFSAFLSFFILAFNIWVSPIFCLKSTLLWIIIKTYFLCNYAYSLSTRNFLSTHWYQTSAIDHSAVLHHWCISPNFAQAHLVTLCTTDVIVQQVLSECLQYHLQVFQIACRSNPSTTKLHCCHSKHMHLTHLSPPGVDKLKFRLQNPKSTWVHIFSLLSIHCLQVSGIDFITNTRWRVL